MITKSEIDTEKLRANAPFFARVLAANTPEQTLLFTLENLGRLPRGFDGEVFLPLFAHPNPKIRCLAVKNVGKLKDETFLEALSAFARAEKNTLARREAVSAIGRLKSEKAIPVLRHFLRDTAPKIILQAVRGLLCFKEHPEVLRCLTPLREHPNELLSEHVRQALAPVSDIKRNVQQQPHPFSPDFLKNVVVCADVSAVLRAIPTASVHLTFTSPPYYNARDYTIFESYEAYLEFLVTVFAETHRVTKEGRFFVLNTSPVIVPRISRAHASKRYAIPYDIHPRLTEIGWEFIDDITWVKPDYAGKNRNEGFARNRSPLTYKTNPVTEVIMVYRKKTNRLIDWNLRQYSEETIAASKVLEEYEKTNVWRINPGSDKVHPAVFPVELASRVIRLYSYKGDLVFDPFAGSGTVGSAALYLERHFFLCEKEKTYVERAKERLVPDLFTLPTPRYFSLVELQAEISSQQIGEVTP